MTKIIGLTGGIGSGKTTVAKYMESQGIPVYIADEEAKKIMASNEVIAAVSKAFGTEILTVENQIDRKKLAQLVFNQPEQLNRLNQIIHPKVKQHFTQWVKRHPDAPFVVKEAAILFETGGDHDCDSVITVTAPLETRIQRVIERDHTDRASVLQRMQNQWTDEQRLAKSHYSILNITVKETEIKTNEILNLLKNQ
ncbi:MAG: Dephospho-CoA kinase [Bacteroidota bacterium]|jgi:dephospho-CoA kinase